MPGSFAAPAAPPAASRGTSSAPAQVLQILALTGFGITASVLGYVFMAPAGALIALPFVWKGSAWLIGETPRGAVRVLATLADTVLALVTTILGFVFLPPAGLLLAGLFLWRIARRDDATDAAAPADAAPEPVSSGNRAFDAYRAETLARLEKEQAEFEAFLARLREARDKAEFDRFMDRRAQSGRTPALPRPATPPAEATAPVSRDTFTADTAITLPEPQGQTR